MTTIAERLDDVRRTVGAILTDLEKTDLKFPEILVVSAYVECLGTQVDFLRESLDRKRYQ
jgi:hypothetical protein